MLYFQMRICSSENQPLYKKFEVGPVIASPPTGDAMVGTKGCSGGWRPQAGRKPDARASAPGTGVRRPDAGVPLTATSAAWMPSNQLLHLLLVQTCPRHKADEGP